MIMIIRDVGIIGNRTNAIQIHIKRSKKLKNGRLTKRNCYKTAVSRPQFEFEIANGGQNEKNRITLYL